MVAAAEKLTDVSGTPLVHRRINHKPVNHDSIEAMTKETEKMVTGTFLNIEYPGQPMIIPCKYYKDQEYFCKTLEDGVTYTIPLSVARHINERIYSTTHGFLLDAQGQQIKSTKKIHRCKFIIGG